MSTADARVTFTKNLTGNVTLDDGNAGHDGATATFNAATRRTVDRTINVTNGSANSEGRNDSGTKYSSCELHPGTLVGTGNAIRAIQPGSSTTQGIATFGSTVNAQTITVRVR